MYVDNFLTLSGSVSPTGAIGFQTVTGSAPVLSTNTIDLGTARDIGEGYDQYLRVQVGTSFAGLTALDLDVITADDPALTVNVTNVASLKAVPVASLTAGARFAVQLSPQLASIGRRYVGARYTPTGTGTAGALFADIGLEVEDGAKYYKSAITVI